MQLKFFHVFKRLELSLYLFPFLKEIKQRVQVMIWWLYMYKHLIIITLYAYTLVLERV